MPLTAAETACGTRTRTPSRTRNPECAPGLGCSNGQRPPLPLPFGPNKQIFIYDRPGSLGTDDSTGSRPFELHGLTRQFCKFGVPFANDPQLHSLGSRERT